MLAVLIMFLDLPANKTSLFISIPLLFGIISLMALMTSDYIAATLACSGLFKELPSVIQQLIVNTLLVVLAVTIVMLFLGLLEL